MGNFDLFSDGHPVISLQLLPQNFSSMRHYPINKYMLALHWRHICKPELAGVTRLLNQQLVKQWREKSWVKDLQNQNGQWISLENRNSHRFSNNCFGQWHLISMLMNASVFHTCDFDNKAWYRHLKRPNVTKMLLILWHLTDLSHTELRTH